MSIIFNEEGLQDITPPCVCQEFVNHNAILYKVNIWLSACVFCFAMQVAHACEGHVLVGYTHRSVSNFEALAAILVLQDIALWLGVSGHLVIQADQ